MSGETGVDYMETSTAEEAYVELGGGLDEEELYKTC